MRCVAMAHVERFVRATLRGYDGSHDIEHARRVRANARHLGRSLDATQLALAEISSYAHDTCDAKYDGKRRLQRLRDVIVRDGRPSADADGIVRVVDAVSYSRLRSEGPPPLAPALLPVWRCVSDADMLEALGVTGMVRTLLYQGAQRMPLESALAYIREALLQCADYIELPDAREEAARRRTSMCLWLDALRPGVPPSAEGLLLQSISADVLLRGTRGSPYPAVLRRLLRTHCPADDGLLAHLQHEAVREEAWARACTIPVDATGLA